MSDTGDLVARLIHSGHQRVECLQFRDWVAIWHRVQSAYADAGPFAAAVAASLQADRLAWAFFCGYQGAIQVGFGSAMGVIAAFAANESQRKLHEIETRVDESTTPSSLVGRKSWVLHGINDLQLFVLARRSAGPAKGPGSLCVVRLPLHSAGVESEPPKEHAVVPELPHAGVSFAATPISVENILPSDGYADYAKPFRLREDVFVTGCALAYLLAEAQVGAWPTTWIQRAIAAVTLLDVCVGRNPRQIETIVLVAGALSFAGDLIREADEHWQPVQEAARIRWCRDRPLLTLGKEARRQRAIQSWQSLGRTNDPDLKSQISNTP